MNVKIKILHILWSGHFGGAERLVQDIINYSDKEIFIHEVCFLSQEGELSKQIAQNGVKVYYIKMKKAFSPIAGLRFIKTIIISKPNIIHFHIGNYLVSILTLIFPNIIRIHFDHGDLYSVTLKSIIFYNYFLRFYDLILTNSNYSRNKIIKLTKVSPHKVKTYYIGIDTDKYNNYLRNNTLKSKFNIPEENKVVGIVARLVGFKGIDDFIKVTKEINELYKKCSFVIVGDGYLRPTLEKMALDYGIKCIFLGERSDVHQLFNMFDIFLFTSKFEPFGIAALESLSSGVPVVGFAVPGGIQEIIERGGGILIRERNHQKLAKEVIDLLNNKSKYDKLSKEGYINVRSNFDIKNNIRKLQEEYIKLTN